MALIDKETIRTEIERRMTENCALAEKADCFGQRAVEDNDILAFLDTLPEQPAEGLEEKIDKYFQGWFNDDEYGDAVTPDYTGVNVDKCKEIARNFYDLGCRHTAVMYDDIEYERQRAEEAELSGDLEEELENYAKLYPFEDAGSYRNLITLARHFAEWGAEHLKR